MSSLSFLDNNPGRRDLALAIIQVQDFKLVASTAKFDIRFKQHLRNDDFRSCFLAPQKFERWMREALLSIDGNGASGCYRSLGSFSDVIALRSDKQSGKRHAGDRAKGSRHRYQQLYEIRFDAAATISTLGGAVEVLLLLVERRKLEFRAHDAKVRPSAAGRASWV